MSLDSRLSDPFEIIVGTYEQYLLGYKVQNNVNEYKIEKSFATHSHVSSIRSITSSKHYLASAGADETVCLYDMRYRRECGKLIHHRDTINCIAFTPEGSHLFTCSNDGSIAALRCGNWQVEKHWLTAHKGSAVNTLAIHPTGKLALSTGEDGVVRTWNLVKGRPAYAINLVPKLKADAKWVTIIKWSPSGEKYLLAINCNIYVYSVETAGVDSELTFNSKVICVEFLKNNLIAIGFENGNIKFCNLKTAEHTLDTKAHDMRVKCIAHMKDILVSASSSGEIKLWRYNKHSLDKLQSVNCGARITCLSLIKVCKNLVQQEEVKLEEEQVVRKKSSFRIRQVVTIENEDECEVIGIENPKAKAAKTKFKKKRVIEDVEDSIQNTKKTPELKKTVIKKKKRDRSLELELENAIDKPKKKKKLLKINVPSKRQKEDSAILQVTLPKAKKIKKNHKVQESPLPHKKHKIKLSTTMIEEAPPTKIRKKVNAGKGVIPKGKRRR